MKALIVALILMGAAVSLASDAAATKTEEIAVAALLREKESIEEAETQLDRRKEAWQAAHAAIISDVCVRLGYKPGTKLNFNNGKWSIAPVRS